MTCVIDHVLRRAPRPVLVAWLVLLLTARAMTADFVFVLAPLLPRPESMNIDM